MLQTLPHTRPLVSALPPWQPATALEATPTSFAMIAPGSGLISFLATFVLGGLFFSTAIAVVGVGMDNVLRALEIVRVVLAQVWVTFKLGLVAAKATLLSGEKQWRWRDAWKVLKERLRETRRVAAEGVKAVRLETTLYAAAVGAPGLIPLQYVLDRLMPYSVSTMMEEALNEALDDVKNRNIKRLKLTEFSAGTTAPQLESARLYDLGEEALAFDAKVHWNSELSAKIYLIAVGGLARIPVTVQNVEFSGTVRVLLTPLSKTPPGYGAALVSLPSLPKINLDVRVAGGEITRVPWLKAELMNALQKGLSDELLWPRRVVVPTLSPNSNRPILSSAELHRLESQDALLFAEKARQEDSFLQKTYELRRPDAESLRSMVDLEINRPTNATQPVSEEIDSTILLKAKTKALSMWRRWRGQEEPQEDSDHQVHIADEDPYIDVETVGPVKVVTVHPNIQNGVIWEKLRGLTGASA